MSDFLTRLTERLRPGRLTLRPVLPSRFEPVTTVAASQTFCGEANGSFAVVNAQVEGNPVAARPSLANHAVHASPSTDNAQAMRCQHQDSTTRVIARTAQRSLEAGEPFVESERSLMRRQVGEAPFTAQEITPPATRLPRRSNSSPAGQLRTKPIKQETAGRSTVPEPWFEEEQSAPAQANCLSTRSEKENLPPNDSFKPTRASSPTNEPRTAAKEHDSMPVGCRVNRQILHEAKETLHSSRLHFPPPKQGALIPAPVKSTYQRMGGDSEAAFDSKLFASPEIRVTIGRIEVRAIVAPPTGPPPPAPRAPRSSLDDYLRSRKEAVA
jgi:hypothetical protein